MWNEECNRNKYLKMAAKRRLYEGVVVSSVVWRGKRDYEGDRLEETGCV